MDIGDRLADVGQSFMYELEDYLYDARERAPYDDLEIVGAPEMPFGLKDDGVFLRFDQ